jgi:prepilin-type N-terminal cleavage/methylation domain-containing protein
MSIASTTWRGTKCSARATKSGKQPATCWSDYSATYARIAAISAAQSGSELAIPPRTLCAENVQKLSGLNKDKKEGRRKPVKAMQRKAFTLIELLIVIVIVTLISAVAFPVIRDAYSHRQVSEAARLVQAAFAGAKDSAMKTGGQSGIRLLPDPAFPLTYDPKTNQLDPAYPLAYNRIIPIEAAPEYTDGTLDCLLSGPLVAGDFRPYPCLMIESCMAYTATNGSVILNETASWFWNVRVGDKLQINGAGPWYTVVGPMVVGPSGGNSELFVNIGPPGTRSTWTATQGGISVNPEYLFLTNGIDDDKNGWTDEGWDGIDNDLLREQQNGWPILTDDVLEWEPEAWPGFLASTLPTNAKYTIRRRPAPVSNSREISLPTNVVIDVTGWGLAKPERSQIPPGVFNPYSGTIDIMLNPNGTMVPTTIYATPATTSYGGAAVQLFVAERSDVVAPSASATAAPYLPIGAINRALVPGGIDSYAGSRLQGEYAIVSLNARTGLLTTEQEVLFDYPGNPAGYNPSYPFLWARPR